jgi:cytidylate kinase
MKKPIITIGGLPGSGKSTIADDVARELDWDRFSSGDFTREIALERGITLSKLLEQAEDNPEIDRAIDARNKNLTNAEDIVIDSRLAFHFIPDSFAVYLVVSLDEGARRIHEDNRETRLKSGENLEGIEETKSQIAERIAGEKRRYKKLYNIDHTDHDNYDVVINTTNKGIKDITKEVISMYGNWIKS